MSNDIPHRLKVTTSLSRSARMDGRVLRPPEERSGLRARRHFAAAGAAGNLPKPKHIMVEESKKAFYIHPFVFCTHEVTTPGKFSPWLPGGRKLSNRNSGVFALERFVPSFALLGDHV